ncbi:MAG: hypothetical protein LBR11_00685 [Deltaproteobacteria bacterium]|jgi:hypothetical protein|nr:hypothetical protein [Deltaproteobacteria bacterium]
MSQPQRAFPQSWPAGRDAPELTLIHDSPAGVSTAGSAEETPVSQAEEPENSVLLIRSWVVVAALWLVALALAYWGCQRLEASLARLPLTPPQVAVAPARGAGEREIGAVGERAPRPSSGWLTKRDLAARLSPAALGRGDPRFLEFQGEAGQPLFVETTLDPQLQTQAFQWLRQTRAQEAALVILNPVDGQVLALAGWGRAEEGAELALSEPLPAASLFKIVTAAAAVEAAEYQAETPVAYDGGKHTLYKGNVIKRPDQGRWRTTLKEGFAESNNTVFGKLGAFDLGAAELTDYAHRFYFNQPLDFEMPVALSRFQLDEGEDLFHLAELASGFNRLTKATPLHGALLASIALNDGLLQEPTLVREVFDRDNNIYYQSQPKTLGQVIDRATAEELRRLMEAAVALGTGRRKFADAEEHPLLSGLVIGGKSGTINDELGRRVEWFVAYSYWPEPGSDPVWPLALAAVVVNEGRPTLDSQGLIRRALIAYYQPLLDGTGRAYQ